MNDLAKLRWQCRRGTKELDLILNRYLDTRYTAADEAEKKYFAELLNLEDSILIAQFETIAARFGNADSP